MKKAVAAAVAACAAMSACAEVKAARGPARMTDIAAIPVVDLGARIGYVGSISPDGDNQDWNWGEVQDENGEWILFEAKGAGCIWNFTQHRNELKDVPTYKFYFDGEKEPRLAVKPKDFGTIPELPDPLAGAFRKDVGKEKKSFRIVRSFVPMPYVNGVRVTSTEKLCGNGVTECLGKDGGGAGGWGHIMYHSYPDAEGLATYDPKADLRGLAEKIAKGCGIKADRVAETPRRELKPGESVVLFESAKAGTLGETAAEFGGYGAELLTAAWLEFEFDGKKRVEAPAGTFFGCEKFGGKLKMETVLMTCDMTGLPRIKFSNRFPMPYFRGCRVTLSNRGKAPIALEGAKVAVNETLKYDPAKTGLFTATKYYAKRRNVKGKNAKIGKFAGKGALAYGVISGYDYDNSISWGVCEGDVRCFIDDTTVPRVQSDGSESWGSWGLGFWQNGVCNPMSWYGTGAGGDWSLLRLTYADHYAFERFLRFDLEHGACNDHPESSSSGQIFAYVLGE